MRSRVHGSTLIEPLVVVSIIAVLSALMLPAIGMVPSLAKVITCGSQLRQINMATLAYTQDNEGRLPRINAGPETYFAVSGTTITGIGLLAEGDYICDHRALYSTDVEHRRKIDTSLTTSAAGEVNARRNYRDRLPDYVAACVSCWCDFACGWGYLPLIPADAASAWHKHPTIPQYNQYNWGYGKRLYWVAEPFDAFAVNSTYAIMPHPRWRTMKNGGTDGSVRMLPDWNTMLPAGAAYPPDNCAYYWPKNDRSSWASGAMLARAWDSE